MFALIPALDLVGGRLGVYSPHGPRPLEAFGGDPLAAADAFASAGARWFHVVDMDLAYGRASGNLAVIESIQQAHPDIRLQCSGGILDEATASTFLNAGAARVVVGSGALADERVAESLIEGLGERALIGLEVVEGRIRARGHVVVDLDLMTCLGWLVAAGAPGFLVTAVDRVGTKTGPDAATVRRIARSGRPTLAAGGIRTLDDVRSIHRAGAVGAVVGHAAVTDPLLLSEALTWAHAH